MIVLAVTAAVVPIRREARAAGAFRRYTAEAVNAISPAQHQPLLGARHADNSTAENSLPIISDVI